MQTTTAFGLRNAAHWRRYAKVAAARPAGLMWRVYAKRVSLEQEGSI